MWFSYLKIANCAACGSGRKYILVLASLVFCFTFFKNVGNHYLAFRGMFFSDNNLFGCTREHNWSKLSDTSFKKTIFSTYIYVFFIFSVCHFS